RAQAAGGGDPGQVQYQPALRERVPAARGRLARGVAGDQLPDLAHVALLVEVAQARAHGDAFASDVLAAAIHGGEQQLEQVVALAWRDVRHHAQVEDRQPVVRGQQQVARVRVGVDLAVHEG